MKLFFYLLDVGTSNALILCREAMQNKEMNVVGHKKVLVHVLVGERISSIEVSLIIQHKLVRVETGKRFGCAYCNTFGSSKKTRFVHQCPQRKLPFVKIRTVLH